MKFFYGLNDHYINITADIFNKCFKDNGIFIPAGDGARCELIGFDPYPYVLKHIMVMDHNGKRHIYHATKAVVIQFPSVSKQLTDAENPKLWWNAIGKHIQDPIQRLNALQKHINLKHVKHGGFEFEYPEQLMCMRHIREDSKVLEIGGNIGRTAHIIHTIINNPKHHIVMECDLDTARELRENLDMNGYTELQIETAALSKVPLWLVGGCPRPEPQPGAQPMPTISYSEICQKYGVDFDVLVADCEGSLFYIFKEDPDMLNGIHTIITENDYTDMDHKQMVDSIMKMKGFTCVYQEKGVPWASWSCCFDYFYEVWKKVEANP